MESAQVPHHSERAWRRRTSAWPAERLRQPAELPAAQPSRHRNQAGLLLTHRSHDSCCSLRHTCPDACSPDRISAPLQMPARQCPPRCRTTCRMGPSSA